MKTFLLALLLFIPTFTIANTNSPQACINDHCIHLLIAKNDATRTKGLSDKTSLGPNEGMLFIFEQSGDYPFWMPDMHFPIDIIWLDQNKKVVFIAHNAQPCPSKSDCPNIEPKKEALYVLEVNAGFAKKHNIGIGNNIILSKT